MFVVRSMPGTTASLALNFSPDGVDHPAPDPADAVVFVSDDPKWGGPGWSPDRVAPWSAHLSITQT